MLQVSDKASAEFLSLANDLFVLLTTYVLSLGTGVSLTVIPQYYVMPGRGGMPQVASLSYLVINLCVRS